MGTQNPRRSVCSHACLTTGAAAIVSGCSRLGSVGRREPWLGSGRSGEADSDGGGASTGNGSVPLRRGSRRLRIFISAATGFAGCGGGGKVVGSTGDAGGGFFRGSNLRKERTDEHIT